MRLPPAWLALPALCFVGLSSCDGDDGEPLALSAFSQTYADAACAVVFRCCAPGSKEIAEADPATCSADLQRWFDGSVSVRTVAMAAGRVVYHGDRARRALDAYQRRTCAEIARESFLGERAWTEIFEPRVPIGGTCTDSFECVGGGCGNNVCVPDDRLLVAAGQQCTYDPGASSGLRPESVVTFDCEPGLFCDAEGSGTCRPLQDAGARCSSDDECWSNACDDGVCRARCVHP